jgi:hypothetical protein
MEQVEASIERYLSALETADRQESELAETKSTRLKDKIASQGEQMRTALEVAVRVAPDKQISQLYPVEVEPGSAPKLLEKMIWPACCRERS